MDRSQLFGVRTARRDPHDTLAFVRTLRFWMTAIAVLSTVVSASSVVSTSHTQPLSKVTQATIDRVAIKRALAADWRDARTLNAELTNASALYAESADEVADETTRTSLEAAIARADDVRDRLQTHTFLQDFSPTVVLSPIAGSLSKTTGMLAAARAAVQQSEQQLAAQKAAAAAQAAAAAARSHSVTRATPMTAPGTVVVWTSGFQAQINACRGAVDVTGMYGVHTIAEHWSCGGSSFPTAPGAMVTIAGLDAGSYRVIGIVAVLNAGTASSDDLPGGYQLLFQTCRNGNSSTTEFVALQSV